MIQRTSVVVITFLRVGVALRLGVILLAGVTLLVGRVAAAPPGGETPAGLSSSPPEQLDEILVIGRHAGPGLWHVSKDGHDLWVLATLEPLPKELIWDAAEVEQRIASSQAVLAPPRIDPHIGFFRGLTLVPSLLHARHNPDGRTLEQTVPHGLYIRWHALRVKYLGNSSDEQLRPMLAGLDLVDHALDAVGLTDDTDIWKHVEASAHKSHVAIEPVALDLKIDGAKDYVRDLTQIPPDGEIACLSSIVGHLETDIPLLRERANLWSLGNVERLQPLLKPDEALVCVNIVMSLPRFRAEFGEVEQRLDALWLDKAAAALRDHASTVAVVPINRFLAADGWLAQLRARGYQVDEP